MTVKISKPAINIREELADLRKPTGIAGEAMLRAETPQEQFNLIGAGRRNLIINGAMQVAQRSTSETGLGNGTNSYKTVDRYTTYISGLGTWTQSQDTNAPSGFGHSLKMLCTAADASPAASDRMLIQTKLEGQDVQSLGFGNNGNTYTVSFYVKSNVTGTYILEQYGDTASATGNNISTAYTIDSANTWERKTITLNVDTGAMTSDNTSGLVLSFWLGSGTTYTSGTLNTSWSSPSSANRAVGQVNLASATNNYWQITGLQLEVGDTATPYEHKNARQELSDCQRYCWQLTKENSSESLIAVGFVYSTSSVITHLSYPQVMRAIPSASISSLSHFQVLESGGGWQTLSSINYGLMKNSGRVFCGISNAYTTGTGSELRITAGHLLFDAEL